MYRRLLAAGWTTLVLVLLCVVQLCGQEIHVSSTRSTIPFELHADFLVVVTGQIGNLDGLKFILDTGASYTMIDRKVADRLHLQRRPGKITNFDRDTTVEWADLPELRVGPLQTAAFPVLVGKLADYSDFTEGVDGIIGLDLLARGKRLFIDYQRQLISWEFAGAPAEETSAPTYLSVPMIVQGARLKLVLDTGLQSILLYKDRLHKNLPQLPLERENLKVNFGRVQTTRLELAGVRLVGPEKIATVFLMDRPPIGTPLGVDGYLGIATLNAKRVEFDFAANTFRWQ